MADDHRPPPEGIFFDLYGTLLLYGDMERAWANWFDALHLALEAGGAAVARDTLGVACDRLFTTCHPPEDGVQTLYERRIAWVVDRVGVTLDEAAFRRAVAYPVEVWQREVTLDPEAHVLLEGLRGRARLALVSNFDHPPHVHRVLDEHGLRPFFETVVISGDVGVVKPDPAIFEPALEATGLDASTVAYVGDAPEDVEAATAAGMRPVSIRRDGAVDAARVNDFRTDGEDPDAGPEQAGVLVIRSLAEVEDLLPRP